MAKTVIIEEFGGSDQLKVVDRDVGEPKAGEVRIAHRAVGLNFIDVYQRTGLYPLELPTALGMEASGVIEAVGEGVTHLKVGDRAAYAAMPPGSYCEARVMPAAQVCPLPGGISFEEGAAMMLKGLTVQYLFHRTTPIKAGDTVLFHAAAGGVGLIACQWARSEGITLIGTAGTDEKCQLALDHGAAHCINYRNGDWAARVQELSVDDLAVGHGIITAAHVIHERFGIRSGSGGAGKWNGGEGIIRDVRFLDAVTVTTLSSHRITQPRGMQGGGNGAVGENAVIRADGTREVLKGNDQCALEPGDTFSMLSPGGGGWGKA